MDSFVIDMQLTKVQTYEDLRQYSIGSNRNHFWEDILYEHPIIFDGKYSQVRDIKQKVDCY